MIVLKDKDTVYFASATGHYNNYQNLRPDLSDEDNMHLWHLNDGKGTIVMLSVRSDRITDLLRYSDVFNCELTMEALREIPSKIRSIFEGTNCRMRDENTGVTIFIARDNRAFRIYSVGAVYEIEDFSSIGCCENAIDVGYELSKGIEDPMQRIAAIFNVVNAHSNHRAYPISVINTKDDSYTLLEEDAR